MEASLALSTVGGCNSGSSGRDSNDARSSFTLSPGLPYVDCTYHSAIDAKRLQTKASVALFTVGGFDTGSGGRGSNDASGPVTRMIFPRTSLC